MSSQSTVLQAIQSLKAAGHIDAVAFGSRRHDGDPEHVLSVSTKAPGDSYAVLRLVRRIDPSAQPLG
jgi:hypothetical protein